MARRRKGRPISGWIVIDKPKGMTSTSVVNKARWAFGASKAGHAGTLDPSATGVLAIAFGEATKTVPLITDALKAYRFHVTWGQSTNTDDADGEVVANCDFRPSADQIRAVLPSFCGDIMQVPPKFSAVKVDGQRSYALARDGADVSLQARPLFVESLELIDQPNPDTAVFEMICGKGGYVRSIARDLGETLGCLGHVLSLRRFWSGPFEVSDAMNFEFLETGPNNTDLDTHLLPLETGLVNLPELKLTDEGASRIRNGNSGTVRFSDLDFGEQCWVSHDGQPVAIGTYRAGQVAPTRVFVQANP